MYKLKEKHRMQPASSRLSSFYSAGAPEFGI